MFGYSFFTVKSEFEVQSPCKLSITALLVDQAKNKNHLELKHDVYYPHIRRHFTLYERKANSSTCSYNKVHLKDGSLILHIACNLAHIFLFLFTDFLLIVLVT